MKGSTLIEAVISLGIITIIVTGVTVVVTTALSNSQHSVNQNSATEFAQEGLEIVRSIRNSNYNQFKNFDGTYCLDKGDIMLGSPVSSCSTPNVDNFIRSVVIQQSPGCAADIASVTVTTSWSSSKCPSESFCHKSELSTCMLTENPVGGL